MSMMGDGGFKSTTWSAASGATAAATTGVLACAGVGKSAIVEWARSFCIGAAGWVVIALGVCGCGPVQAALASGNEELEDASARVEYAFYTSDTRSISDVLQMIERLEPDEAWLSLQHYYAAFGYWKLAQLHTEQAEQGRKGARGLADRAGDACTEHADKAVAANPRLFEAQALKAACSRFGFAARLGDLARAAGCSRHKALRAAEAAEPKNPRIKLIDAWCMSNSAALRSKAVLDKARAAVDAFEATPINPPGAPNWGEP